MSDRFPPPDLDDDDEPVIGLTYGLPDEDSLDTIGAETAYDWDPPPYEPPLRAGRSGRAFGYEGDSATHHPAFFVFVALAIIVGGAAIFTLYSFVQRTGGDGPAAPPTAVVVTTGEQSARVLSPRSGTRVESGKVQDFAVQAHSPFDPVVRFQLFVNNEVAAVSDSPTPGEAGTFTAQIAFEFVQRGEYTIFVRAATEAGKLVDSDKITVIAREDPGQAPEGIRGRVVARSNVLSGPGPQFSVTGAVNPDEQITIFGRSSDSQWLLIDDAGSRWVRRAAIQESDSLTLVPVREARATPVASPTRATATPVESASPSPTPTQQTDGPDLTPSDARFVVDGARRLLRITITNEGQPYSGPLVVGITTNPAGLVAGQTVIDAKVGTGESVTIDLDLAGDPPERTDIVVKADPQNLVKERSEDNNTVTFKSVPAPAAAPRFVILSITTEANVVTIVIQNQGGALPRSRVEVSITIGAASAAAEQELAVDKNGAATFRMAKPASGRGTVVVKVNGVPVASGEATLP